ncbi:MAG TPA: DUF4232 domain-containing protein [Jatrophihabitans sp.]|nr:DUF4232 domain-containing protein [Jatrophihabitans sp.]
MTIAILPFRAPTAVLAALAVVPLALLAGCQSGGGDAHIGANSGPPVITSPAGSSTPPSTPPASTTAASTTPASTTAAGGAPASTGPAPSGPAACAGSAISVREQPGQGAAGHLGVALYFTNVSAGTCTLTGYPGVALLTAAGHQAMQAERTPRGYLTSGLPAGSDRIPTVTLAPHETARAGLEWEDVPRGDASCGDYPALLVTPPNTTRSTKLAVGGIHVCQKLQIHPVLPG